MHIGPKTPLSHSSSPSPIQGAETNPTSSPSKLHLAGQFLSRSVKSLGSTLKSGFVSTYQWAKKTGSDLFGPSAPLSEAEKQKDKDYAKKMIDQSFNL